MLCDRYSGFPPLHREPTKCLKGRVLAFYRIAPCLSAVSPKWSVLGTNIVSSMFSLADRTLENATLDSGKFDSGLVSAGSNGVQP